MNKSEVREYILGFGTSAWNAELSARGAVSVADLALVNEDLQGIQFRGCKLPGAYFYGASLTLANFDHCELYKANFDSADLREAEFFQAKLIGASFDSANCTSIYAEGADFSGADLTAADFGGAFLNAAKFSATDFTATELFNADIRGADLSSATSLLQKQIDDAIGDESTILPAGLQRPHSWSLESSGLPPAPSRIHSEIKPEFVRGKLRLAEIKDDFGFKNEQKQVLEDLVGELGLQIEQIGNSNIAAPIAQRLRALQVYLEAGDYQPIPLGLKVNRLSRVTFEVIAEGLDDARIIKGLDGVTADLMLFLKNHSSWREFQTYLQDDVLEPADVGEVLDQLSQLRAALNEATADMGELPATVEQEVVDALEAISEQAHSYDEEDVEAALAAYGDTYGELARHVRRLWKAYSSQLEESSLNFAEEAGRRTPAVAAAVTVSAIISIFAGVGTGLAAMGVLAPATFGWAGRFVEWVRNNDDTGPR